MSDQRLELHRIVCHGVEACNSADEITDAIIDAGYHKMTPVESVEQLVALPEDSIVIDFDNTETIAYQKESGEWYESSSGGWGHSSEMVLRISGKLVVAFVPVVGQ
ncbi:hypothetical protein E3_0570 [Rhodococcus phage E3]|uniref:hypothetical protein n=1 Tax=Rhodococcus phage E3 TaxID=1007869 RepID=UPI0002C6B91A|nr:hypothetical protein M176_gp061 [Rhodococcus phage E3]AEQ20971.1 hypothetical protein E3_0570 [Rhodococcus phage E3]